MVAGPEKRRSKLSILRRRRGRKKIGVWAVDVCGGWTKGKKIKKIKIKKELVGMD